VTASDRPELSFVVSTLGPAEAMRPLLDSLTAAAEHIDLELIVADQSHDQQIEAMLARENPPFGWQVTTSARGLSRGRNAGLPLARGSVVAFPDDDLRYPPGVLAHVVKRLRQEPTLDGLGIGLAGSDAGTPKLLRSPEREVDIAPNNVVFTVISCGLFIRRRLTALVGAFDERFGAGSGTRWGAGEETDYALRCLAVGARLRFDPTVWSVHVDRVLPPDEARAKSRRYGEGTGSVLRRHGVSPMHIANLAARRSVKVAMLAGQGRVDDCRTAAGYGVGLVVGFSRPGPAMPAGRGRS